MPLPKYRNYQTLVNLVPGATPGQYQNSVQAAPARALSTNVNGVNRNNNATRIDGALSVFLVAAAPYSLCTARRNNRNRKYCYQQLRCGAGICRWRRNHGNHKVRDKQLPWLRVGASR